MDRQCNANLLPADGCTVSRLGAWAWPPGRPALRRIWLGRVGRRDHGKGRPARLCPECAVQWSPWKWQQCPNPSCSLSRRGFVDVDALSLSGEIDGDHLGTGNK